MRSTGANSFFLLLSLSSSLHHWIEQTADFFLETEREREERKKRWHPGGRGYVDSLVGERGGGCEEGCEEGCEAKMPFLLLLLLLHPMTLPAVPAALRAARPCKSVPTYKGTTYISSLSPYVLR